MPVEKSHKRTARPSNAKSKSQDAKSLAGLEPSEDDFADLHNEIEALEGEVGRQPAQELVLAVVIRIPLAGVAEFQRYEAQVLPLLASHGGTLERRMRNTDRTMEVHVIRFASRDGLEQYRSDPRRTAAAGLLKSSGATTELIEVTDVADGMM